MKKIWFRNPMVLLLCLGVFATWLGTPAYAEKKTVRIAYEEWSSEIASTNLVKAVIREKLGWAPSAPLRKGMEQTYAWIAGQVKAATDC